MSDDTIYTRCAELEKRCERLEKGLRDAIDMFLKYAEIHKEKNTEEGNRKAQININFANALEIILAE